MNITLGQILCFPFGGMFNIGLISGIGLGYLLCAYMFMFSFDKAMRRWFLWSLMLICSTASAAPVLLDSQTINNGDGTTTWQSQSGGWWVDDAGIVLRTDETLKPSDGVWGIENTSAPHKVYAATDEVRWRVDPPAGEAAGFEISFSTVSLYLFDEVNGDVEKTINWPRTGLVTTYNGTTINYPLFADTNLYVLSTPEGYKTNFYFGNPGNIPSPTSAEYFGPAVDINNVYVATRYSVSKWPDSDMYVDGTEYGPGSIVDGYSATFGNDIWMLPTKAYRNVTDFDGVDFTIAEDESYVYYVFDRLAQEILVLAPYTLFVGAQNVLIDPTTWTSAGNDTDDGSYMDENAPTTNRSADTLLPLGGTGGTKIFSPIYRFTGMPSSPGCTNVSATVIFQYVSTGGSAPTPPSTNNIRRLKRAWVEGQVTWNVYTTGNNWGTAGAGNSSTDYDETISKAIAAADIAISNDATFNGWCQDWIDGTTTNNGFYILGVASSGYFNFGNCNNATAANRPYLAVTYTIRGENTLATLPATTTSSSIVAGSVLCSIVQPVTSATIFVANIADDVTADIILDSGTHVVIGEGAGADDSWDVQAAADTVYGGTLFVLSSNYAVSDAAGGVLYFNSSLTGATSTVPFTLSPSGGGSADATLAMQNGIFGAIQAVTTDGTWGLPALNTSIAAINTLVGNASTALTAEIRNKPTSIAYPVVGYPTNTETGTLYVPSGVYLQEEASLEILSTWDVEGVTPDLEIVVGNDADNGLVSFNSHDAMHASGWTFSRTSSANIDGTTEYVFRMRYEIPSSAITASGTGTLRIEGSYFNPQLGPQQIHNTVAMYARSIDANEASTLTSTLSTANTSLANLDTRMKAIEADAVWTVFTDTEISGATSTYNAAPGYCFIPATYPAMYAKVDETSGVTETIKLVFIHWAETASGVYTPAAKFEVDPGTWTVSGEVVTSATVTDIVKGTGQSTSILQYNTGGF